MKTSLLSKSFLLIISVLLTSVLFASGNPDTLVKEAKFKADDFVVKNIEIIPPGRHYDKLSGVTNHYLGITMLVELYLKTKEGHTYYPSIIAVTTEKGDTIATGDMNYYGHRGQTSQNYPLSTKMNKLIKGQTYYAHFTSAYREKYLLPFKVE